MWLAILEVFVNYSLMALLGGSDDASSVQMFYYKNFADDRVQIQRGDYSLFNKSQETLFIVHGFASSSEDFDNICKLNKLKNKNVNIVNVDWAQLAVAPNYFRAARSAKVVGDCLGQFILDMGIDPGLVRCVGFSLGAHVSGFAGKFVKGRSGKQLKRISGLDPAGPLISFFEDCSDKVRLAVGDAVMVDCLHTNRGLLGSKFDMGDVNFYANSAWFQPGCQSEWRFVSCSHYRAVQLYAGSILDPGFVAKRIDSFSENNDPVGIHPGDTLSFGQDIPPNTKGLFYFQTGTESPFSLG